MFVDCSYQNSVLRKTFLRLVLLGTLRTAVAIAGTDNCTIKVPEDVVNMNLEICRPEAVTLDAKADVLASLPTHGEIRKLGAAERNKLLALNSIFGPQRRSGIYDVKVIDLSRAWIGIVERVVVLITQEALRLLSAEELRAVVAHEIAHEYVTSEYIKAKVSQDTGRLRTLELICDAIAVVLLERSGLSSDPLTPALRKLTEHNRNRFGNPLDYANYPTLEQRRNVIESVAKTMRNYAGSKQPLAAR
jgi:hypothetical protein